MKRFNYNTILNTTFCKNWMWEYSDASDWINSIEIKENLVKRSLAGTVYFYTLSTFISNDTRPFKIVFKVFKKE